MSKYYSAGISLRQYRIIRKNDAETRWVYGLGKVDFETDHTVKSLVGTIRDVTTRNVKTAEIFKPISAFKTPALDFVGPIHQPTLQGMFDALYPPGLQWS